MRMSDEQRRNFPVLTRYIRYRMPEVFSVSVIVNNMRRFGNLSQAQLRTRWLGATIPW